MEDLFKNDELKIYRGRDFVVSKHIHILQPTLDEICEYGEQEYYSMVYQLTATPQSMKWQLWELGTDYTTITPYELFYNILYRMYPQEKTAVIFGDLDLTKFQTIKNDNGVILSQEIDGETVEIDEYTYTLITDYMRKAHLIKKDEKMPANESTKMVLIEDDKAEYEKNKDKEYHSQLKNLISTMINSEGFNYNHDNVWDIKINAFMDSVRRLSKIKNADLLLQSGYSGFGVSLKEISADKLDWFGGLE